MLRPRTPDRASVLRGLGLLARFDADGIDAFDRGVEGVSASLAPLMALPVVIALLTVSVPGVSLAFVLRSVLPIAIGLLAPLIITHALARRWGRIAVWPRYAAAFDWCSWLPAVVAMPVLLGVAGLIRAGLPVRPLIWIGVGIVAAYALALQWFVARHALAVSGARATAVVLVANGATAALTLGPTNLYAWLAGLAS